MGWLPSLGGVFKVVTEPVECADAEGNMGLRVGGLLVAMVGLKVTLRAGRSGFLPRRGVDSAVVAMMQIDRVSVLWNVRRYPRVWERALLFRYEWSKLTRLSKSRHNRHQARRFGRGWASRLPLLFFGTHALRHEVSELYVYIKTTFIPTTFTAWLYTDLT